MPSSSFTLSPRNRNVASTVPLAEPTNPGEVISHLPHIPGISQSKATAVSSSGSFNSDNYRINRSSVEEISNTRINHLLSNTSCIASSNMSVGSPHSSIPSSLKVNPIPRDSGVVTSINEGIKAQRLPRSDYPNLNNMEQTGTYLKEVMPSSVLVSPIYTQSAPAGQQPHPTEEYSIIDWFDEYGYNSEEDIEMRGSDTHSNEDNDDNDCLNNGNDNHYPSRSNILPYQGGRSLLHLSRNFAQNCCIFILSIIENTQMWLAAALLGILAACVAAFVEVVTGWLTGLKMGICRRTFWVDEGFCCLDDDALFSSFQLLSSSAVVSEGSSLYSQEALLAAAALAGISQDDINVMQKSIAYKGGQYGYAACPSFQTWPFIARDSSGIAGIVLYVVTATSFAALSSWLCLSYAPKATGSGIIDIKAILSGVRVPRFFDARVLVIKCLCLPLSVGSGLTLGKEGPFVHVGCCLAYFVAHLFPRYRNSESQQRELLSSGAAVGVAVAFGAPIGGVLFSLEEVSYYFPHRTMLQAFFASIISILVLTRLDPTKTGHLVQFAVVYKHPWHWFEMFGFSFIGIVGGMLGSAYTVMSMRYMEARLQKRSKVASEQRDNNFNRENEASGNHEYQNVQNVINTERSKWSFVYAKISELFCRCIPVDPMNEVVVLTILTSLLCYLCPLTRYGMLDVLGALFSDCLNAEGVAGKAVCVGSSGDYDLSTSLHSFNWIPFLQILFSGTVRLFLLVLTTGVSVPAGIFVPCLFIGACFGRVVGLVMDHIVRTNSFQLSVFQTCIEGAPQRLNTCVVPGVYAIVGAAALLCGVTRMTICLVVIMLEITGSLEYVVPCMVATIVSKLVGELMNVPSIYDVQLSKTNYPFIDPKEEFQSKKGKKTVRHLCSFINKQRRSKVRSGVDERESPGASQRLVVLRNGMTLYEIATIVERFRYRSYPIISPIYVSHSNYIDGNCNIPGHVSALYDNANFGSDIRFVGTEVILGTISRENVLKKLRHAEILRVDKGNALACFGGEKAPLKAIHLNKLYQQQQQGHTHGNTDRVTAGTHGNTDTFASITICDWSSYVNCSNLFVTPEMPVELLLATFKALRGVHCVIVHKASILLDVVSIKDLLAYVKAQHRQ